MRFTQEQKMRMVHARALLLSKMRTILNERNNLVAAAGVSRSSAPPVSLTKEPWQCGLAGSERQEEPVFLPVP